MTLTTLHVCFAATAIVLGTLAGWGGLALIVAKRTHGKVRLPLGFRLRSHMTFGVTYLGLLVVTLILGFVAAQGAGGGELIEWHERVGIVAVVMVGAGGFIGLQMRAAKARRGRLRALHVVLTYGACLVLAVQVVLGLMLLGVL